MAIGIYTSIIIFKVNGLNAPTKRHRLAEWMQKPIYIYMGYMYGTHIYAIYKTPTSDLKTHIVCVRGWKNTQPRLLHLARISFKSDREIKSFSGKQKLENSVPPNQLYNKC